MNLVAAYKRPIKAILPFPVYFAMRKVYHDLIMPATYARSARNDAEYLDAHGIDVAPPPNLRHRTHGSPDLPSFLKEGERHYRTIEASACPHGPGGQDAARVLDFGCGCGRTALWFRKHRPELAYTGVDLDRECIGWNERHLRFGHFLVGSPRPPLPFDAGSFDLIFSISVFTHLSEDLAAAWLAELARVARPRAYVLLSIYAQREIEALPRVQRNQLDKTGLYHARSGVMHRIFPDFYQNTYHGWDYIVRRWGQFFEVVDRVNIGVQDLVVMRAIA
ncbi:MAG TPA: class I SAM-dependent methyltransferase [Gemmatimonadales bacterium]|nr:class I SAM-dependent methyltransferase [Gemmatimonadales bacterium]